MNKLDKGNVYYILAELRPTCAQWMLLFGDYSRALVKDEQDYCRQSGEFIKGTKYKIIKLDGDTQAHVDNAIAELNQGV